jgi:RNA polymerase sigma-70 factor (ECF subfamily)
MAFTRSGELLAAPKAIAGDVDDAGLLERAGKGDVDAFSALFGRYQRPLHRYAAHMCGREAADDVVQETFLAVLRQPGQFDRARGTVGGYLFGIARHLALKRVSLRDVPALDGDVEDRCVGEAVRQPSVLDRLTRAETIDAVRAAIRTLPPLYREVIVLCELQEMEYQQAAEVVQCPIGTIRSRLHRAKAMLMAKLACAVGAGVTRTGT